MACSSCKGSCYSLGPKYPGTQKLYESEPYFRFEEKGLKKKAPRGGDCAGNNTFLLEESLNILIQDYFK